MTRTWGFIAMAWLAVVPAAAAQTSHYSHRGSLGLQLASGALFQHSLAFSGGGASGARIPLDFALSYGPDDATDWSLWVRGMRGPGTWSGAAGLNARVYSGPDVFKTFYDLGLSAQVFPLWAACVRVGFGAQYELSEVVGVYSGAAMQLGFGAAFHFGVEWTLGLQLRTYWFE